MKQFVRYACGTHVDDIEGLTTAPLAWAPIVVGVRLLVLIGALFLAVAGGVLSWLALSVVALLAWCMLRALIRISLHDMVALDWSPSSPTRFVGLVFANLIEVVIVVAVVLASVESIESRVSFRDRIDSPGDALVSAAAPFGTPGRHPVSGLAEFVSFVGVVAILFMTVIVIAAAVNGYTRRSKPVNAEQSSRPEEDPPVTPDDWFEVALGDKDRWRPVYEAISTRRAKTDGLRWETPALGVTAQAVLLAFAFSQEGAGRLWVGLGVVLVAIAVASLMAMHSRFERIDTLMLSELEAFLLWEKRFEENLLLKGVVLPHARGHDRWTVYQTHVGMRRRDRLNWRAPQTWWVVLLAGSAVGGVAAMVSSLLS